MQYVMKNQAWYARNAFVLSLLKIFNIGQAKAKQLPELQNRNRKKIRFMKIHENSEFVSRENMR